MRSMKKRNFRYSEEESQQYFAMLNGVREAYIQNWTGEERQSPYKFGEWFEYMTPIERNVWSDIRHLGLPFYPQFPVGKYYIDFADPFRKIAIEVDGRIHDDELARQRDRAKEAFLRGRGWHVLRIPGYTTYKCRIDYEINDYYDDHIDERFWTQCSEGILQRLMDKVYRPLWRDKYNEDEEIKLISSEDIMRQCEIAEKKQEKRIARNKIIFSWSG